MSHRLGELTLDGERAILTFVRHLPYPVEAVWSAIADPAQRAAWFGETSIDGRAGGVIDMVPSEPPGTAEQKRMTGRILVWDPPHVLEHEWYQSLIGDSVVRYELAREGDSTVLTFTHRGLGVRNAKGFTPGTHAYLDRLESYLAGTALPSWLERYQEVAPDYAASRRQTEVSP
ncbi:SRPBCC family protein [Amycolatopsis nigrescens]|uniref:SRPBCC family protein n=1 Tax=Amycolatopsis nigrescens TaxID=381445 RepID=UPI00037C7D3D|nr:SRPBCC family protein [Amycolatopsis nigrescens]